MKCATYSIHPVPKIDLHCHVCMYTFPPSAEVRNLATCHPSLPFRHSRLRQGSESRRCHGVNAGFSVRKLPLDACFGRCSEDQPTLPPPHTSLCLLRPECLHKVRPRTALDSWICIKVQTNIKQAEQSNCSRTSLLCSACLSGLVCISVGKRSHLYIRVSFFS